MRHLSIWLVLTLSVMSGAANAGVNMLYNPGFEETKEPVESEFKGKMVTGWNGKFEHAGKARFFLDREDFHGGRQAIRIEVLSPGKNGRTPQGDVKINGENAYRPPVEKGKRYRLSIWMKADRNHTGESPRKMEYLVIVRKGQPVMRQIFELSNDWKKYEFTGVASGGGIIREFYLHFGYSPGTFWIDDVEMECLNGSDYVPPTVVKLPPKAPKKKPDGGAAKAKKKKKAAPPPVPGSPAMPIVYTGPKYAQKHSDLEMNMVRTEWAKRHDARLRHAIGVNQFQVLRANRSHPAELNPEGKPYEQGHTYNHAPNITWWNDRCWVHYLSSVKNEHDTPGRTLVASSPDGADWSEPPRTLFPDMQYTNEEGKSIKVYMHQRMGFFNASNGRLLGLGFYTKGPGSPNKNGDGMGRVVREIRKDASFGKIFFLRKNKKFPHKTVNIPIPMYTTSDDQGFKEACDELLANRPVRNQMWEEDSKAKDGLYVLAKDAKALCYYTRKDGAMVAVCKDEMFGLSFDNWKTVSPLVQMSKGNVRNFDTTTGKSWAQRTADDRYALVLHPQNNNKGQRRYPLAVTTSDDGITFSGLQTIAGELPPRRYQGKHKEIGPQYVRGIVEHNIQTTGGTPPNGDMWLAWSMNKEDIWAGRTPVPIRTVETRRINETFEAMNAGGLVENWNTYSPLWAPVRVAANPKGKGKCLMLEDRDPADYAKAFRVFTEITGKNSIQFDVFVETDAGRVFDVDVQSATGVRAVQLRLDGANQSITANGKTVGSYAPGSWLTIKLDLDLSAKKYGVSFNGKTVGTQIPMFEAEPNPKARPDLDQYSSVERLVFRTGEYRMHKYCGDGETYPDRNEGVDMENVEIPVEAACIFIDNVKIDSGY